MHHVSLIIPIYNAAPYIEACLASLMAQTMDNIEVLLIDDHGSDNSIQLAKTYVVTYPSSKQFRFLATPCNMGPGAARNVGIKAAKGEYVGFIDSDDVVSPDFCERLYNVAKQYDAELAYCQAELVKSNETSPLCNPIIECGAFDGVKRKYFLTHYTTLFVSFLYRRSLLNEYDITFPDTRSAEDSCFLTCALLATQRIACVNIPLYKYLVREDSLSEARNPKRYVDKVKSFDLLIQFAKEKNLYEANKAEVDYIYLKKGYLLGILTYIYNEECPQRLIVQDLHNHLLSQIPHYKDNSYYHNDFKLRLLHTLIRRNTQVAFKIIPWYLRKTKMKL